MNAEPLGQPIRQPPIALIFIAIAFLRNLGAVNIGIALVFVFSGRLAGALGGFALVAVVVGALLTALSWWRFTFQVIGDELVVTKGILSVERLSIPFERVQSVGIEQQLLHRLFGVVKVKVDTAGSGSPEFEIDAIHARHADALQRIAADRRSARAARGSTAVPSASSAPGSAASAPGSAALVSRGTSAEHVVLHRTPVDLVRIGLTRVPWAGLVVLGPLIAVGDELADLAGVRIDPDGVIPGGDSIAETSLILVAVIAIGVVVAVTVVGAILQLASTILTNWNLTLTRSSNGLRRTAGLLSTTSSASTLRRVQSMTTDDNPAQRWLGITQIGLHTVGAGDLVFPGSTDDERTTLRRMVLATDQAPLLDRMISRRYVFLETRNAALLVLPIVGAAWIEIRWWALVGLVAIPLRWLAARRHWRRRRWGLTDDRIAESYELLSRHTAELRIIKAQTVTVRQSLYERRHGLATIRLDTAEGHLAVPLIHLATAHAVRDRILFAVESTNTAFM